MLVNGLSLIHLEPMKNMVRDKKSAHGTSYGLSEAGYDIRIKQDILFRKFNNDIYHSDLSGIKPFWDTDATFSKGRFVLASAIEEFQMPPNLTGVVHDKSTWARKGLSVFNTVIEAGWKGFLTLELVYHGDQDLHIPAGSGIAQVLFHQNQNLAHYHGKYQDQPDHPVQAALTPDDT